jgi:hypothetical protein
LSRISQPQRKFDYDRQNIFTVDGHSIHVTLHVIAVCGTRNFILIRLVTHSSHLAQPLDFAFSDYPKSSIAQKDKGKK